MIEIEAAMTFADLTNNNKVEFFLHVLKLEISTLGFELSKRGKQILGMKGSRR